MRNYKKSYRKKRTFKRRYRFRKSTFGKKVKRVIFKQSETKYFDYSSANVSIQSGLDQYNSDPYFSIAVGTGRENRIGNKIHATWLNIRMELFSNNIEDVFIRFGILRWKGIAFNPTKAQLPANHLAFIDPEQWTKIRDMTFNLGNSDENGSDKKFKNYWIKINRDIIYDAASTGAYQKPFIIFCNSNDQVLPSPTASFFYRVYFKDV